jgi:hypothetical protein
MKKELKFLAYRQIATPTVKTLIQRALPYIQFCADEFSVEHDHIIINTADTATRYSYQSSSGYIPTYLFFF